MTVECIPWSTAIYSSETDSFLLSMSVRELTVTSHTISSILLTKMTLVCITNPEPQNQNKATVAALYTALANADLAAISTILASDLEWWFHGPPHCQHMMKVLTGESLWDDFVFEPRTITALDDGRVIAEGWPDGTTPQSYWVHVWTVNDGVIVQFREYFNTWITVQDLRMRKRIVGEGAGRGSGTLWQSHRSSSWNGNRAMPGLVLAI